MSVRPGDTGTDDEYDRVSRARRMGGPGWMVAAAFIGPGTVTTATLAGAGFGTALLWALAFSIGATLVLQEMSARLGVVTGLGLGEAIRRRFSHPVLRLGSAFLIVSAIGVGNAAFQTGNLLGAGLGLEAVAGGTPRTWALVIGLVAGLLLWSGRYRLLEGALVAMVGIMSVVFLVTAVMVRPSLGGMASGLFVPRLPDGALLLTVALVGTTVVPYNLFLHASAVRERFRGPKALGAARRDLTLSILVGGAVSMAIVLTAAGTIHEGDGAVADAADMARQLEPLLGAWAGAFFAVGLLAAGMTSSVTAPLAAAWATAGALGWRTDLSAPGVRMVWMLVLGTGMVLAGFGVRPVEAILFAQAANGVLLPCVAVFLLLAVNDARWMGDRRNGKLGNLLGVGVTAVALGLGLRGILAALGLL